MNVFLYAITLTLEHVLLVDLIFNTKQNGDSCNRYLAVQAESYNVGTSPAPGFAILEQMLITIDSIGSG